MVQADTIGLENRIYGLYVLEDLRHNLITQSISVLVPSLVSTSRLSETPETDLADTRSAGGLQSNKLLLTLFSAVALLCHAAVQRLGWDRLLPQPALFVESLGVYTQEQSAEKIIQRVVLPAMDPGDLLKLSDGQVQDLMQPAAPPQQQQRQQQYAAQAAAPPAEPIRVPGMPDQPSNDIEAMWMSIFLENHLWIDNRATVGDAAMLRFSRAVHLPTQVTSSLTCNKVIHVSVGTTNSMQALCSMVVSSLECVLSLQWPQSSACMVSLLQKTGRQPDFKKRQQDRGKDAVWLDDRRLPAWAKKNLDKLPGGQPFPTPSFIPAGAANNSDKERAWVELFSNYSAFWDNRLNVSVLGCVQCVRSNSSIGSATCSNVMENRTATASCSTVFSHSLGSFAQRVTAWLCATYGRSLCLLIAERSLLLLPALLVHDLLQPQQKLSPRGPDFSPKDKGAYPALWENEAPDWVKQNWDKLPAPPPRRT